LRIAAARASALLPQIRQRQADGWNAYLITLTLRHHQGQRLGDLFGVLSKAWGRLTSGRGWADLKRNGLDYVRGYDLTLGASGWHPHIHIVLLIAPGPHSAQSIAHAVAARWRAVLASLGAEALDIGQDVQKAKSATAAAAYAMTLSGIAEATSAAAKRARKVGAGRTAMDLAVAAAAGDDHAAALWREYAAATRGRRCVVVSQGLKLAGEEEAAATDDETLAPEIVAFFLRDSMKVIDPHLGAAVAAASRSAALGRAALEEALGPPGKHWHMP